MRTLLISSVVISAILSFGVAVDGQQPDRAAPPADGPPPPPGKAGPPRPRDGDGFPPGKAGPRGRGGIDAGGFPVPAVDDIRLAAERIMHQFDRNGNGKLERSEWEGIRDPERADANSDGEITLDELLAHPPTRFGFGGGFGGGGFGGGRGGGGFGAAGFSGRPGMAFPGGNPLGGEMPPDDPEMREILKQDMELDRQTQDLAARYRDARGEERLAIKNQLTQIVNKHFDVRQKRRELQLKRMEEELKRLRDAIGERNDARETIVGSRLRELIGDSRNLDF